MQTHSNINFNYTLSVFNDFMTGNVGSILCNCLPGWIFSETDNITFDCKIYEKKK